MSKEAVISARIDSDTKRDAERVFKALGLTATEAITIFYGQVALRKDLPFSVEIPNAKTRRALKDAEQRRNLESFDDVDDLFEDLAA